MSPHNWRHKITPLQLTNKFRLTSYFDKLITFTWHFNPNLISCIYSWRIEARNCTLQICKFLKKFSFRIILRIILRKCRCIAYMQAVCTCMDFSFGLKLKTISSAHMYLTLSISEEIKIIESHSVPLLAYI